MSTFDDREKAQEAKYAHDAELMFKAEARRNKLLGEWAAELMGRDAAAYAKEVIASDFEEAGDEDVFRKVTADFAASNVDVSEADLRAKMVELKGIANEQVQNEG
jgi:hypothetical protein